MTVPSVCETAVAHYLSKGITKDVAVGIASVLYHESNLNPISENNSGTETGGVINPKGSYGIAQWNGPRQAALKLFATGKNEAVSALNTQLDFVLTECANSYPQVWNAILQPGMTYQNFIPIFVNQYERPANESAEVSAAMAIATPLYALSISAAPAPVPTPVVATPASTPIPTPTPTPAPLGVSTMNPATLSAMLQIIQLLIQVVGPELEALAGSKGSATAPAAPVIDAASLANSVGSLLLAQLGSSLPGQVAAEVGKLIQLVPPAPAVKS